MRPGNGPDRLSMAVRGELDRLKTLINRLDVTITLGAKTFTPSNTHHSLRSLLTSSILFLSRSALSILTADSSSNPHGRCSQLVMRRVHVKPTLQLRHFPFTGLRVEKAASIVARIKKRA
jgi:hypothetical protein